MIASLKTVQSRQGEEELRPKQETCLLNSGALQERERQSKGGKERGSEDGKFRQGLLWRFPVREAEYRRR